MISDLGTTKRSCKFQNSRDFEMVEVVVKVELLFHICYHSNSAVGTSEVHVRPTVSLAGRFSTIPFILFFEDAGTCGNSQSMGNSCVMQNSWTLQCRLCLTNNVEPCLPWILTFGGMAPV